MDGGGKSLCQLYKKWFCFKVDTQHLKSQNIFKKLELNYCNFTLEKGRSCSTNQMVLYAFILFISLKTYR